MSRRRGLVAVLSWLPVAGIILALFVAPSSPGAASSASLSVTPRSGTYGGQQLTFSGAVGPGNQTIWLQWRGNSASPFVTIPSTGRWTTGPGGRFEFTFPAPTMNLLQVRVVSRTHVTPAHILQTEHQEADVLVRELRPASVPGPDGPVLEPLPRGFAVTTEPYTLRVDTVNKAADGKRPVLPGREVRLQSRDAHNVWTDVSVGYLGESGLVDFADTATLGDGVYRARLGDWRKNGDNIGWFPSLPFYFDLVDRPLPVIDLQPDPAPTSTAVHLKWTLTPDPNRDRIVVVRGGGGSYLPTWATPGRFVIKTLDRTATSYIDTNAIEANRLYRYAVYTVSKDGVYSEIAEREELRTPYAERGRL